MFALIPKTPFDILELGNQKILINEQTTLIAKNYLQSKGVRHISMDINNQDGAIAVNLALPFDSCYLNKFDVVTDFGTVEHIENQYQVWKNINDACKVNGYMIHSLPLAGYWKGHCPYHYTDGFPEIIADKNGYRLVYKEIKPRRKEKLLNFIFQKIDFNDFYFSAKWVLANNNYKHNSDNLF